MIDERFRKVEDEYFRLKGQLSAGRITQVQFESLLKDLMIEHQGLWWMVSVDTGEWHVRRESGWVRATPPAAGSWDGGDARRAGGEKRDGEFKARDEVKQRAKGGCLLWGILRWLIVIILAIVGYGVLSSLLGTPSSSLGSPTPSPIVSAVPGVTVVPTAVRLTPAPTSGGTATTATTIIERYPSSAAGGALTPVPMQFAWDFSPCGDQKTTRGNADIVDGSQWTVPGGCLLRLLVGGQSFVQAVFNLDVDPRNPNPEIGAWKLTVSHLSSNAAGGKPGYSPVRITANGEAVWSGSPSPGKATTDALWAETSVDVTVYLHKGSNTLRWDLLSGAASHYWLKSFRLVRGPI